MTLREQYEARTAESDSTTHGPHRRYHVYRGRSAHLGDFSEVDRHIGYPLRTLCGKQVDATYVSPVWTPPDCRACHAAQGPESAPSEGDER